MDFLMRELSGGFSDGYDVARSTLRLLFAIACGALIGYERERMGKAAGLRTHILVASGSALAVIAVLEADIGPDGVSRVIQGLVTGIGFLGAGAIIKRHSESDISGLTTAAGIWMTSITGIAAGLGHFGTALLASVLTWCVLSLLHHVGPPQVVPTADTASATDEERKTP